MTHQQLSAHTKSAMPTERSSKNKVRSGGKFIGVFHRAGRRPTSCNLRPGRFWPDPIRWFTMTAQEA
jgi:hypothetical protein